MTIAPPRGPTQKHCLGPQVLLQGLVYLWKRSLVKPQVGRGWEVNIGSRWDRESLLNKFWIDKAWKPALFSIGGLSGSLCNESVGAQKY
jgi:hypothetical protein